MENDPAYKAKSAWEHYESDEDRQKVMKFSREYIDFISKCKTERETIAEVAKILAKAGFSEDWQNDKVMAPLRGKALFAVIKGSGDPANGIKLIAAHADSPRLDLKQRPITEQAGIAQARTHYYGGLKRYQWLARPLALHGVVIVDGGKKIEVAIGEKPDEPVFCIADLLPHLAKDQGQKKVAEAFDSEKLNIVLGHEPRKTEEEEKEPARKKLLDILQQKYGFTEEDLITAELEAVPAGPARFVGLDESMIGGYGQDDRICLYCALMALLAVEKPRQTIAVMFWDKEEIGSEGASGASSRFLQYCIEDLCRAWCPQASPSHVFLRTRAISADVTAGLDPDYQDVHEKQNAALMGYGPVFSKYTGSGGKYGANDADAEFYASLRAMFNKAAIPWQAAELGKVGLGGGGTVALFMAAYGMQVIDLGPALLSMHSPFELSSIVDLYSTWEAYKVFFMSDH